jgi:hypothetical protein
MNNPMNPKSEGARGSGVELIAAERQRQISVEGWTPDHDDEHSRGELATAASVYLLLAEHQSVNPNPNQPLAKEPACWPWSFRWWKPSADPIRNLVKAGALIAAEIDRLQRAALQSRENHPQSDSGAQGSEESR